MFRISRNGQEPIVDVGALEEIEPVIRRSEPGQYLIDEMSRDPLPSGQISRRWGFGIKRADGSVSIKRDRRR
jgi:hypothetical protein